MDVSLRDSKKARKISAAVLLLKQQEMAILAVTRPYENPMEVLNVIRKDQFDLFLKTVNLSLSTNQTEFFVGVKREAFDHLLSLCRTRNREISIPAAARLFLFLKFVREGRSQNSLSKDIGISQATVCRVVNETMYDILATANTYIKFPSTIQEIEALENGFSAKTDYLGNNRKIPCFGCLDGKHWATEHPPNSGSFLLADNGFKLTKSVMEPYRKTQLTTENVFDRSLKLAPENAQALIVALMIVHNVQLGPLLVDNNQPSVVAYPDPYKTPEEMRTALKNYVLNN